MEIKNKFENKSIQKRIEFIEGYNFEEDTDNRAYFIHFIKENSQKWNNDWYTMWLIDLAGLLQIKDVCLLNTYLRYLIQPNSYLLKLTVLDYITDTYNLYKSENIDYLEVKFILSNKHERMIVKNTALLTLMLLFPVEKKEYMLMLKKNLLKTFDYRSHIRVYNFFIDRNVNNIVSHSYLKELMEITISQNFGRSVQCTLLEVEAMFCDKTSEIIN